MAYLVANLSIPASDEEKIKDAFQNALQWEYSKYVNPIYALFFVQPKVAIILAQKELVEELLTREANNPFQLGGPLSATFTSGDSFPTNLVEISFSDPNLQYDILSSLREKLPSSNFTSFMKSQSSILRFPNPEDAAECVKTVASLPESSTVTPKVINANEHVSIRAIWKGPSPLGATIKRLKSSGQTLTGLVQSCLSIWTEQPLVLAIQMAPPSDTTGEDEAIIICATPKDSAILSSSPLIELIGGSSLRILTDDVIKLPNVDKISPETREVYIFWDYDSCPYTKDNDSIQITDNITSLLKHHLGVEDYSTSHNITSLVFIPHETETIANRPSIKQIQDLTTKNFKIIYFTKKDGADTVMRTEVELVTKRYRNIDTPLKPCVCVIGGDKQFNPTLATLKLESFNDVIFIHSSPAKHKFSGLAEKHFSWNGIQSYHTLSNTEKFDYVHKSFETENDADNDSTVGEKKSGSSITGANEMTIEIQWLAVATHFKNIIIWADPKADLTDPIQYKKNEKLRSAALQISTNKFLMGERDDLSDDESDKESTSSTVTLYMDTKDKKYRLTVTGHSKEDVIHRHKRLTKMMNIATKDRKIHPIEGWDASYRESLMNSLPILTEEKDTEATVLFHYTDGNVLAEIVAFTGRQHKQLLKFITSLQPKETVWNIPKDLVHHYDERKWAELFYIYAVHVEKEQNKNPPGTKVTTYTYLVFGFKTYIENALAHILESKPFSEPPPVVNAALSMLNAPFSAQGSISAPKSPNRGYGSYIFQDREAGVFYQNFEVHFRRYLSNTYNVDVQESTLTLSDAKMPIPSVPNSQQRNQPTLVKVTFTGNDQRNINACRSYFDQLNSTNLQRHQVFFPHADQIKYKEILSQITKTDSELQTVRGGYVSRCASPNRRRSSVSTTGSQDSFEYEDVCDPMEHIGFVSVRVKPPLHSRGVKRMSLPSDVTVTVCGPVKNAEQKNIFKTTCEAFDVIDTGNFVATAEVPSTSPITKQLTVRTSRDEFIHTHSLSGLRYEESSRITGLAGVARIFAPNELILKNVLRYMEENGVQNIHIVQRPNTNINRNVIDTSNANIHGGNSSLNVQEYDMVSNITDNELDHVHHTHETKSHNSYTHENSTHQYSSMFSSMPPTTTASDPDGPPPGLNFNLGPIGSNPLLQPVTNDRLTAPAWGQGSSLLMDNTHELNNKMNDGGVGRGGVGGGSNQLLPQLGGGPTNKLHGNSPSLTGYTGLGDVSDMNRTGPSLMPGGFNMSSQLFDFGGLGIEPISSIPQEKRVVRWPHHSFRFMFLGDPLKQSLMDLLNKMREKHGLITTYPHRDKSDHSACLLLEGSNNAVTIAAEEINKYMRSVYQQMRCLQLIISEADKKELISNDLNRVKDIQGQCGVHLVLDPLPTDMNEASSTYDLRLPYTDHLLFENPSNDVLEPDSDFKPLRELLSVVVTSKVTGQNVVVSVIDNKSSPGGWNWGVNNVLLMLDPSADIGLNVTEIEQLDKGEVLVNTENSTGKRILRVRPERSSFSTRGIERQAEGFVAALSRGLAAADSLHIQGIAVVAPTSTQYYTDLSMELIQSLTMEAIVAFIRRAPVRHLSKILCLEMPSQLDEQMTPQQYTEMALLLPAGGDRMALTLLILLEQANDPINQQQPPPPNGMNLPPYIQLRTCNVPLPRNVRADDLLPSLAKNRPKVPLLPHQIPPMGTSPIILRGLTDGLRLSLKTIKQLISSYAETRKANETMNRSTNMMVPPSLGGPPSMSPPSNPTSSSIDPRYLSNDYSMGNIGSMRN